MSKFYADLRALENSELRLRRLTREIEGINKSFMSIRNSLDRDVRYSRGIDGQFSELSAQLSEEEHMLFKSANLLKKAVEDYKASEKILNDSLEKINTDTKLRKTFDVFEDAVTMSHAGSNGNVETEITSDDGGIMEDILDFIGFDPGRPGRFWDKVCEEWYTRHPIFWGDISLELFFDEAFDVDSDTYREWRHGILEIGGFIPGPVGPICDILDSIASFREGQWVDGLSSLVFAIPGIGDLAGAIKLNRKQEAFLGLCDVTNEVVQDIIDENMDEIRGEIDRITDEFSEIIVDRIIEIPSTVWKPNPIQELLWELINWNPAIPNTPLLVDFWGLNQAAKRFVNIEINKNVSSMWNELDTPLKNLQNPTKVFVRV